ncbi:helix-turn-helix transcriptional regulator [Streptomyces sp. SID3343]|uniref:helix-turn-helix domain-containing protein n=1 Tax=Streptomyces sp. SID3343 TaxID=2690260 RepID=UPI00136FC321|nr:helix-turn-helix transcriptional regulator [Streptomyces sp. SID3343]MYV98949.1 helix-turn-helix domain-containing protein [Streptomyces sp. SID3343]
MAYSTDDQLDLGALLRELRAGCGLSLRMAAPSADLSAPVLSRLENGQRSPASLKEVERLLDLYGATGEQRGSVLGLAEGVLADQGRTEHWSDAYADVLPANYVEFIRLEAAARSVTEAQISWIPGLLQTERYARSITQRTYSGSPERVEDLVLVRLKRQELLSAEPALSFTGIITEAALRTEVGGPQAMHHQLRHLAEKMRRPNIEVIIVPYSTAVDAALASTFTVFDGLGGGRPDRASRSALSEQGAIVTRTITWDEVYITRARRVVQRLRHAALSSEDSCEMIDEYAEFWRKRD